MTKLIVVILIPENLESHHATEATKKVHELRVTVEPEGPHEVPKPLAVPNPMRSLKSKLAIIPKILNQQKFLKSYRLSVCIAIY